MSNNKELNQEQLEKVNGGYGETVYCYSFEYCPWDDYLEENSNFLKAQATGFASAEQAQIACDNRKDELNRECFAINGCGIYVHREKVEIDSGSSVCCG